MKIKILLIALTLLCAVFCFPAAKAASFNPFAGPCTDAPNSPTCQQAKAQASKNTNPVVDTVQKAVSLIAAVAGVAAVVVIIISGFMFVTAGAGDPNRAKTARSALLGAVVGLAIIALSWTLVTFVIQALIK